MRGVWARSSSDDWPAARLSNTGKNLDSLLLFADAKLGSAMKKFLKWLLSLVAIAIVLVGAFFIHVWYFKPAKIDWFYGRVFGQFALQSPELLSNMRILPPWLDFYSDDLDDASPAHEAEMADMIKRDVDTLHRYDRTAFDQNGALSYDVLDYFLSIQVEGDRFRDYDFPVNQLAGIQSSLPNFMAQTHQVNNKHDADAYIARLDKFPVKFGQVVDGLKLRESKGVIPPQFTVEEVLTQMQGFIGKPAKENMLYTSFKEKLDKIPAGQDGSADARHAARRRRELDRQERLSGLSPAHRLLQDAAAEGAGQFRRVASAGWRCVLRVVRAHAHDDGHDARAGAHARPRRSRAHIGGNGRDPERQGPRRRHDRRARAAARARAGCDVPEHAGRQEGDARAVPGDPRRSEQGSRRRVRRAARSSASK